MRATFACVQVLDAISALNAEVLRGGPETDFLHRLAATLQAQAKCDAVLVHVAHGDVVALATVGQETANRTQSSDLASIGQFTPSPGGSLLPEAGLRLVGGNGALFTDVRQLPGVPPIVREHLARLEVGCGFAVPLVQDGEFLGHVVFAWRTPRSLSKGARRVLHKLARCAAINVQLYRVQQDRERDPLTGLFNRLGLERRWQECSASPRGALLFADLDGFKALNDVRGHLEGDRFLRELAEVLRVAAPAGTVISRYGGDEFVLLIPGAGRAEALQVRAAIMECVRAHVTAMEPPQPAIAIGISLWPHDGRSLQALIGKADQRMYQHKRRQVAQALTSRGQAQGRLPGGFFEGWLVNSPDSIIITDPDMKILYVNPAYERRAGYPLRELVGKRPNFIASGRTPREVYDDMWRALHTEGAWKGHVINRHRDDGDWIASVAITKIVDRRGRLVGYLGISRDVTTDVGEGRHALPPVYEGAFTQEALAFALAAAAEMHDQGSRAHLERIREFTRILVKAASPIYPELQSPVLLGTIALASVLHDIGKIAVPTHVLAKPGPLTEAEFELVKSHTIKGWELLQSPSLRDNRLPSPSHFLRVAANIARSHHERWDGTGYPDGLAGEEIPLEARIVAIADVYDALRSERPYKPGWSHQQAVEQIRSGRGRAFDPALVEVFLQVADSFAKVWDRMNDVYEAATGG